MAEDDLVNLRKQAIAKALERIETVNPMLNVIITGHLMIEEEMNALIKTLARFPDEAEKNWSQISPESKPDPGIYAGGIRIGILGLGNKLQHVP
jgi:hypothetical protein